MDSKILTMFNQGKHEEAIQAAVKAIDAAPDDPKRYAMLATMLISIKALDQAGELLAKARQLFPEDLELQYTLACLRMLKRTLRLQSHGLPRLEPTRLWKMMLPTCWL
jgi:Flp pilus assembly protein TadD